MQGSRVAKTPFARALLLVAALSGCNLLPSSGPTARDITRAGTDPSMHIIRVTPSIATASRSGEALGFGSDFVGAGVLSPDTISPGDTLAVRVWENVEAGLLTGAGEKVTTLEAIPVDQAGNIYIPYAGELKASGKTPDQLRQAITEELAGQTPDPQVEVRRVAGDGATVSVMGGVADPGVYPLEIPTRRLTSMLAQAGGVAVVPDVAQIKIQRAGHTGRIWLQDLYDNPRYDVALRGGDRIIVEEDRRSFTALGAATKQARVQFNKRDMSAVEAIAASGGLDGRAANPTGVFVFRDETPEITNRVLGRSDLVGPQRVAYLLDLTSPDGLFAARDFIVRDEDTIYITEAPLASWGRILTLAAASVAVARSIDVIATN